MLTVQCALCGKTFAAQRSSAKYCSSNHRTQATYARQRAAKEAPSAIPLRQDGARLVAVPPSTPSREGFVATTRRQLEAAGQLDTYQGVAAMFAAQVLDSGSQDTMSSMAAMIRTYQAAMKDALEDASDQGDELEQLIARRRQRSA